MALCVDVCSQGGGGSGGVDAYTRGQPPPTPQQLAFKLLSVSHLPLRLSMVLIDMLAHSLQMSGLNHILPKGYKNSQRESLFFCTLKPDKIGGEEEYEFNVLDSLCAASQANYIPACILDVCRHPHLTTALCVGTAGLGGAQPSFSSANTLKELFSISE